jgi:TonB family protein
VLMRNALPGLVLAVLHLLSSGPSDLAAQRDGDVMPVATVLDSVAFDRELKEMSGRGLGSGRWIGWAGFIGDEDTVGVRTLESSLPASATDSIRALVKRSYIAPADAPGMILTLSVGDTPAMRVHRARSERPRLLNERDIRQRLAEAAKVTSVGGAAVLRIWVNEDGRAELVIVHASSGWPPLDAAIVEIGRRARFAPARIDDYPIEVWVQQRFSVTVR